MAACDGRRTTRWAAPTAPASYGAAAWTVGSSHGVWTSREAATAVSCSSDGSVVVASGASGRVHVARTPAEDPTSVQSFDRSIALSTGVLFGVSMVDARRPHHVVTSGSDRCVRMVDLEAGTSVAASWGSHDETVKTVAADGVGGPVVASGSRDGGVTLWDVRTTGPVSARSVGHGSVTGIVWRGTGAEIATTTVSTGKVSVWDTRRWAEDQNAVAWTTLSSPWSTRERGVTHMTTVRGQPDFGFVATTRFGPARVVTWDQVHHRGEAAAVVEGWGARVPGADQKVAACFVGSVLCVFAASEDGATHVFSSSDPSHSVRVDSSGKECTGVDVAETGRCCVLSLHGETTSSQLWVHDGAWKTSSGRRRHGNAFVP